MSVHYTDKISHLLAMDDMAGSSLLQSIRVWTNLIRQGCQDISLIWGAGNSLRQCGVLFGGLRATECRCAKELMGSVFGFGSTYTKRASERCHASAPQTNRALPSRGLCDGNLIEFICSCIPTEISWNLTSIMSGEYLIRPYQAMKNCLCLVRDNKHSLFSDFHGYPSDFI